MSLQKYVRCVVICKTYKTVFLKRPMFHLIFGAKISMKLEDKFCYSAVQCDFGLVRRNVCESL